MTFRTPTVGSLAAGGFALLLAACQPAADHVSINLVDVIVIDADAIRHTVDGTARLKVTDRARGERQFGPHLANRYRIELAAALREAAAASRNLPSGEPLVALAAETGRLFRLHCDSMQGGCTAELESLTLIARAGERPPPHLRPLASGALAKPHKVAAATGKTPFP